MSKSIRVRMDLDESEFKEVSIEEAKKLVADACARRMVVLNKKTKHIIREITEDVVRRSLSSGFWMVDSLRALKSLLPFFSSSEYQLVDTQRIGRRGRH
jgi:hypothetical protein